MGGINIDALVRRCSRIAEDIFKDRGGLDPIWLLELADERQEIIASPIPGPDDGAGSYKEQLASDMRRMFRETGVRRYAWAMECWGLESETKPNNPSGSINDHPDRTEAIILHADDGFQTRIGLRQIIRTGGGVYLGKLRIETPGPRTEGRFFNLLGDPQQSVTLN